MRMNHYVNRKHCNPHRFIYIVQISDQNWLYWNMSYTNEEMLFCYLYIKLHMNS